MKPKTLKTKRRISGVSGVPMVTRYPFPTSTPSETKEKSGQGAGLPVKTDGSVKTVTMGLSLRLTIPWVKGKMTLAFIPSSTSTGLEMVPKSTLLRKASESTSGTPRKSESIGSPDLYAATPTTYSRRAEAELAKSKSVMASSMQSLGSSVTVLENL